MNPVRVALARSISTAVVGERPPTTAARKGGTPERSDGSTPMDNAELASVFDQIAGLLDVMNDSPFKIRAYRNAARVIASYPEPLRDVVARGGNLRDIPGIGAAIAKKTAELLSTGRLAYFEKLKESAPAGVLELMQIPGIGPRTAARLSSEMGIVSVDDLEIALRAGSLSGVPGLGEKVARSLLQEIETSRLKDV
jgi:DNA polymerase (family X)